MLCSDGFPLILLLIANVAAGFLFSKATMCYREDEHMGDFDAFQQVRIEAEQRCVSWTMIILTFLRFNVGERGCCVMGAEVRMRQEHTLEKKNELEDKRAGQANLLSERDTKIAHLKSLLSLKEAEATEAISLRGQLTALEAADASKIAKLLLTLSGFSNVPRDELNSKVASLESERDCLVHSRDSERSGVVLIDRVVAIDSDLMEIALHMDSEFYPRYLTTIAGRRWLLNRGLKLVLSKCLSSPEYFIPMAGHSYNPSALIVVIGETSLAFSLEVAHNRVQRLRGDATARRLSLTDSIRPLVEPLSSRVLTGEASSSADVTVTTALATTFAQTFPIPAGPSTEVPPSPKIVFEEEELDTTPEHALAP
ncbi:hypothetical protein Tco_0215682 [Tanacetum coccineum]